MKQHTSVSGALLRAGAWGVAWLAATPCLAQASGAAQEQAAPPWQQMLLPIIIILIVIGRRIFVLRGSAGSASRSLTGDAVCPKCGEVFARSFWSPNLVTGKLCRCPHCGGWSVVARATPAMLAAAAAAHQPPAPDSAAETSPAAALRRRIEDSKYERGGDTRG